MKLNRKERKRRNKYELITMLFGFIALITGVIHLGTYLNTCNDQEKLVGCGGLWMNVFPQTWLGWIVSVIVVVEIIYFYRYFWFRFKTKESNEQKFKAVGLLIPFYIILAIIWFDIRFLGRAIVSFYNLIITITSSEWVSFLKILFSFGVFISQFIVAVLTFGLVVKAYFSLNKWIVEKLNKRIGK